MIPVLALAGAVGTAAIATFLLARLVYQRRVPYGTVTPERQVIFEMALDHLRDPGALRKLADEYDRQGLRTLGDRLRKRAEVQELPDDIKAQRREVYRKARSSTNIDAILKVAAEFDANGSPGAATNLRMYVDALKAGAAAGSPIPLRTEFNGDPSAVDPRSHRSGFAGDRSTRLRSSFGGRRRGARRAPASSAGPGPQPPQAASPPDDGSDAPDPGAGQ